MAGILALPMMNQNKNYTRTIKIFCNKKASRFREMLWLLFIASNFVTLTKTSETDWNDVIPTIRQFLKEYLEEGKAVINEEELATVKQESSNEVAADDDDVVKRVKELLENYVKPAVEMDGGAIQFKSYDNGVVNLMLQGSCSGCPSSMITLKAGIEGMMKRMIPEVKEVVAEVE